MEYKLEGNVQTKNYFVKKILLQEKIIYNSFVALSVSTQTYREQNAVQK
jgi:hypothetical protein